MFKRLAGSKTFWTGLAGICTAVGAYVSQEITLTVMVAAVFNALMLIFIRDGIAKPPA